VLKRLLLTAAATAALAAPVHGFGLKTHLYIADQVWQDLSDCRVSIRGADFAVPQEACRAIRGHRGEFLAGALGPDVFPDVLVGQAIVHPGVPGGWQANDWLNHLLSRARSEAELAFAWGYAMHYAGDSFAHSYVNNYAGGVFDIGQDRTKGIELRHFRLEKYIDQHLDYAPDPAILRVPAAFLSAQLVQYDYGAGGGPRTGDFYDSAAANPEAFAEGAAARLRRGGPAAPVMTLLTMLDIARVARARAPGQEAQERARLNAAAAAVAAAELRWSLPHPDTYVPDERSAAWRAIPNGTRGEVEAAYRLYRSQVEAWQQARALTAFTRAWVEDLELAAERYVEASLEFGRDMVRDGSAIRPPFEERGSAVAAYRRWLACYAPVLEGNPARAGDLVCERLRAMRSDLSLRRAALLASAGARPRASYFRLLQIDQYLGGLVEDVVIGLAGLSDRAFGELLEEALAPAPVGAARLNATFEEGPNGQLSFRCVADWIDADLGMRPPPAADAECDNMPRTRATLDPARFAALDDALVLARLALLDQAGVRAVTARFGGNPAELRMGAQPRYSVLLDSIRSLDGSHPWRGTSLPFPRRAAWRSAPPPASAGYGFGGSGPAGFPLYQSEALRRTVFAALFRPFEGAILARPEMLAPAYPFRPCPGDPLRPGATGAAEIC
jgi:hypothetical protein